ncbi:hypothetical protein BRADI_2g15329v3 [Brachypodium distachyon]|uniref:Uncharacterized protein n=1 Tax=Brachypodium distachyon TaxID=15368 RepID=A0A2K2D8R5_BRADI|nr:hypothetical protein BRADI_2g15329v3 [Brachypodium distachyon]
MAARYTYPIPRSFCRFNSLLRSGQIDQVHGQKRGGKSSARQISDTEMFKYRGCSWPEMVGMEVDEAERIIKQGKPDLYVSVVPEGQMMTMCYSCCRVQLVINKCNRVLQVPHVG